MRKLNTILSVLLLFICLLHGLMGSFMLLGISSGAGKFLAWIGVGILAAHTVLGLLLTAQTFRASRSGGKLYGKQNALFWARRTSGLAICSCSFSILACSAECRTAYTFCFRSQRSGC